VFGPDSLLGGDEPVTHTRTNTHKRTFIQASRNPALVRPSPSTSTSSDFTESYVLIADMDQLPVEVRIPRLASCFSLELNKTSHTRGCRSFFAFFVKMRTSEGVKDYVIRAETISRHAISNPMYKNRFVSRFEIVCLPFVERDRSFRIEFSSAKPSPKALSMGNPAHGNVLCDEAAASLCLPSHTKKKESIPIRISLFTYGDAEVVSFRYAHMPFVQMQLTNLSSAPGTIMPSSFDVDKEVLVPNCTARVSLNARPSLFSSFSSSSSSSSSSSRAVPELDTESEAEEPEEHMQECRRKRVRFMLDGKVTRPGSDSDSA
jgi:hypothetical protein